jgi:hypothetical protein
MDKMRCQNCSWSWGIEKDDTHPFLCHKCGYDSELGNFDMYSLKKWEESIKKNIIGAFITLNFTTPKTEVKCKVDTGAETNSVHCTRAFIKNGKLYCELLGQSDLITFDDYTRKNVTSSNGLKNKRYCIKLQFNLGDKTFESDFTLNNRSKMKHPVLLGKNFLNDNNFIVDVTNETTPFQEQIKNGYHIRTFYEDILKDFSTWKGLKESVDSSDALHYLKIEYPRNPQDTPKTFNDSMQFGKKMQEHIANFFAKYPSLKVEGITPLPYADTRFKKFMTGAKVKLSVLDDPELGGFFEVFGLSQTIEVNVTYSLLRYKALTLILKTNFIEVPFDKPDEFTFLVRENKTINFSEKQLRDLFSNEDHLIYSIRTQINIADYWVVDQLLRNSGTKIENKAVKFIPTEKEFFDVLYVDPGKERDDMIRILNWKLTIYLNYYAAVDRIQNEMRFSREKLDPANYQNDIETKYRDLSEKSSSISQSEIEDFYLELINFEKEVSAKINGYENPIIDKSSIQVLRKLKDLFTKTGFNQKSMDEQLKYYSRKK